MQGCMRKHGLNRMRYAARILSAGVLSSIGFASSANAANPRKAPTAVRDCSNCPEMVSIPAGRFLMGTAAEDPLHDALEGPRHKVTVRSFLAGKYDVTRSEWAYFVRSTSRPTVKGCQWTGKVGPDGVKSASWDDLGFEQTDRDPVVCVTWQDAKDYAKWLTRKTGKRYRLLSEAEWEYAARAGTTTPYFWGAGASHEH